MSKAKSFAALYSRLSAKARQAVRRKVTADQVLSGVFGLVGDPSLLGVRASLTDRHKAGATLVVSGQHGTARIPFEYTPGLYSLYPTLVEGLLCTFQKAIAALGFEYDNVHTWDYELRDLADRDDEIAELRTRIGASLGPVHVTHCGVAFRVYDLGESRLVEYREPGAEYITVVGLTKFLEVING